MVVVGLTGLLPSAGRLVPPSIDTLSAPVVVQVNVAVSPTVMAVGAAEKLSTVGGGGTVTVMDWDTEFPTPASSVTPSVTRNVPAAP